VWRKGLVKEAYPVWEQILKAGSEAVIKQGESYTEALAAAGFGADAERVWKQTIQDTGGTPPREPGERLTNGDFEAPLRNAGLDWRMAQAPGYKISLDDFQSQSGSRSLRVQFDGTTNPEFYSVQQWVPVEPETDYYFRAFTKTENISTDNGMFLHLSTVGAPPDESWARSTENRVGSNPWTEEHLNLHTGPDTRVILVQLRRSKSAKLNNLLQGTVWLENVSLRPVNH